MPKNINIEGGIPVGAPQDWDPEKHGECGTLQVLMREGERGWPELVSAYRFTPAEQAAIAEGKGNLFLCIIGAVHPVISLWVQEGAEIVGDGLQPNDGDALVQAATQDMGDKHTTDDLLAVAWAAMLEELELQAEQRSNAPDIGEADPVGQLWMSGTFGLKDALAVAIEAAGLHLRAGRNDQPPETVDLPVMTLGSVAAEAQAKVALETIRTEISPDHDAGREQALRQYELVSKDELRDALLSYENDPPNTDYQRGHLRGLQETAWDAGVIDRDGNPIKPKGDAK